MVISTDLNFSLIFGSLSAVKYIFFKEIMFSEITRLCKLKMVREAFVTYFLRL